MTHDIDTYTTTTWDDDMSFHILSHKVPQTDGDPFSDFDSLWKKVTVFTIIYCWLEVVTIWYCLVHLGTYTFSYDYFRSPHGEDYYI